MAFRKAKNKYASEDFNLPDSMGGVGDMSMGGGMTDPSMGMSDPFGGMDMGMGGTGGTADQVSHASNGLFPQDVIPVRGPKRLWRLLGIEFQPDKPKHQKEKKINLFSYTANELKYQPGFMRNTLEPEATSAGLSEWLTNTSLRAAAWERESKSTNIMSPEIRTARDIMVASIMSPIDLQTNAVNIVVESEELTEVTQNELSKILSDYFNDELKFGRRLAKWIGNALYQTGATPVLVLPQSNIRTLRNINDEMFLGTFDRDELIKATRRKPKQNLENSVSGEKYLASFEGLSVWDNPEQTDKFIDEMLDDAIDSMEELDFIEKSSVTKLHQDKTKFREEFKSLIDKSKNFVMFSTDVGTISKHTHDIRDRLRAIQREIDKKYVLDKVEPIYVVNTEHDDTTEVEAPSIIELPYQAVVPVIVPGSPNQHIGYFIMVNQWGEPINPDSRDMNDMNANSRLVESNVHANFGVPSALLSGERSPIQQFKITSQVFGTVLRHLMEQKLDEYGLGGTRIEQHEAITTCLLRNMLDKRLIGLIFVPEPMLTYYHFDTHPDGTGKSLIEDVRTLTGLRTTLVTANIMAATENSIDQKIIELNVGEMNANAQQLMEQVKNAFTEKRIMRYDNNPLNVQRDLIQKSLTFVPKGIKGLQDGLTVETQHKNTGAVQPDRDLMDWLDRRIDQALLVPKSVIDKGDDEDFARSIVTTNLFFNNRVKMLQQDVNDQATKTVRNYVKYSTILRNKLKTALALSAKDYDDTNQDPLDPNPPQEPKELKGIGDESLKPSMELQALSDDQVKKAEKEAKKIREKDTHPPKSKEEIEMNDKNIDQQLDDILEHIFVKLPEPRIVVDKAQTEEINQFMNCIDGVLSTVYNDELLPDDFAAYANVLKMYRAREKARLAREFIKKVGYNSVFDLPPLDQLDTKDLYTVAMFVINSKRGMDNISEQIGRKLNLGNRAENQGMVDIGGGVSGMGNDFNLPSDMGGTGGMDMSGNSGSIGEGTLGGVKETNADMNMNSGNASSTATSGGEENGGMPNIDLNI